MFKMDSNDPFGYLKHKLWTKKGQKSNWQFDSRPLKFKIALISLRVGGVPHIVGKFLMKATTLL
jgi:hypothetical protein